MSCTEQEQGQTSMDGLQSDRMHLNDLRELEVLGAEFENTSEGVRMAAPVPKLSTTKEDDSAQATAPASAPEISNLQKSSSRLSLSSSDNAADNAPLTAATRAFEQDLSEFINSNRTFLHEQAVYQLEKALVSTAGGKLYFISVMCVAAVLVLGTLWAVVGYVGCGCDNDGAGCDAECVGPYDGVRPGAPLWVAWSFLISAGYNEYDNAGERLVVSAMIIVGLVLFAVVIGLITEGFHETIDQLKSGKTKAVERNHILILGWNHSTPSLICKLAQFREEHGRKISGLRGWLLLLNPVKYRYLHFLGRVKYPIFTARIVILSSSVSREEMEMLLEQSFQQEGVDEKFTKLNRDVIPRRLGSPAEHPPNQLHAAAQSVQPPPPLCAYKALGLNSEDNALLFASLKACFAGVVSLAARVILRTGEESNLTQLCRVSVTEATRIVVMLDERDKALAPLPLSGDEDDDENALSSQLEVRDSATVRVLLALRYLLQQKQECNVHVVAQLSYLSKYVDSLNWAVNIPGIGSQPAMTMLDMDFKLTSLMLSCVGQPGLASALEDMLDRTGVSVKVRSVEKLHAVGMQLIGASFEAATTAIGNHLVMGLLRSQGATGRRTILLNPNPEEALERTDEVIIIGEGEPCAARLALRPPPPARSATYVAQGQDKDPSLKVLFCGWRKTWSSPKVFGRRLAELCNACSAASRLTFLNTMSDDGQGGGVWPAMYDAAVAAAGLTVENTPLLARITHEVGFANDPDTLRKLGAEHYSTFVVLSTSFLDDSQVDISIRDSRVLTSVMAITKVKQHARLTCLQNGQPVPIAFRRCNVISEIADDQLRLMITNYVAHKTGGHSEFFNVSDMVSSLIAQICYNPVMDTIWQTLLTAGSSDMYCVPAYTYITEMDGEIPFWNVMHRVREKHPTDIFLGYVTLSLTGKAIVTLAPQVDSQRIWDVSDRVIVMSRFNLNVSYGED
ncbi:hypothetical protein CYMTET_17015 [Cymbomonas tetramitiformis]|uniref:CASTOR/POLLUX/SYM8 ion channel conserved domain-containing protein n=1 Tax=Cymbomonas tetramitiformis TaxID=36881 RepID=A0AAE0GBG4_9CHLO|nr:hypothetical protein CYMTET_17015 [Cymbomonas tetramitiformis]